MLKTRSILAPFSPEDGLRISIMSRHTLEDGKTPNPEIQDNLYEEWWPELAPPTTLIGAYYRRDLAWPEFEDGYKNHLDTSTASERISELIDLSMAGVVTVLCIEEVPDHCHRRLLVEECAIREPRLEIEIK